MSTDDPLRLQMQEWCVDPRHEYPCRQPCHGCEDECDPAARFNGDYYQAENKLDEWRAKFSVRHAEGISD